MNLTLLRKILVFAAVVSFGIFLLYETSLIGVITVLIVFGIGFGLSGLSSKRLAPYPADAVVSFIQKIKGRLKNGL